MEEKKESPELIFQNKKAEAAKLEDF